ncbi:MAG: GFA family protein [Actinomycetota bacterium]
MNSGACACGAVRYRVDGPLRNVTNCHCERCRRITGHFMAASACATADLTIEGEPSLRWYRPDEEPAVGYAFCRECGASLFWRSDTRPESISICAGTLDPPTGIVTDLALFGAEASDYHRLDDTIETADYDR